MNVNLALPYKSQPSPPRSEDLAFSAPSQPDFLFGQGEEVVIVCQPFRRAMSLKWALSYNGIQAPIREGEAQPGFDNSFTIEVAVEGLKAGFYDLKVEIALSGSETVSGLTTFGWQVEDEVLPTVCPDDFQPFWNDARQTLESVPLDLNLEWQRVLSDEEISRYNLEAAALPEHYDAAGEIYHEVEVYKVSFASAQGRVYGWFTKPVGVGPFPGLLVLPGAGNNPRPAPVEHARHGFAALDIQVHGNEVDLTIDRYEPVSDDRPQDLQAPAEMRHFNVYLNALQAVRALRELPGVDAERIAAVGGSQGGRLTMVVAALDPRIRAAVAAITHYAALPWVRWVAAQNEGNMSGGEGFTADAIPEDNRTHIESYFDVVNFALLVRCPVLMNAGLIDPVSMPTGVFAAYRAIGSTKEIVPLPNLAHDWSPAFDRYAWKWLRAALQ